MRRLHGRKLVDPLTKENFKVFSYEEVGGHIISGLLMSKTSWYPIIRGVPRILVKELKQDLLKSRVNFFEKYKSRLPKKVIEAWKEALSSMLDRDGFLRHQRKTADSFAFEWNNIYRENAYERNNFFHFLAPFTKKRDLKDKMTLDVGCGSGRFTKQAALCKTKISFGTDLGDSVDYAFKTTKELANVCIVQSDIYALPFLPIFDVVYSIGVLHHLPEPQEGFMKLKEMTKKKGRITIWVYNRRNNNRALYFYEPIRAITRRIPPAILYRLCYFPAIMVHIINLFGVFLEKFGGKKWSRRLPFFYYANFPFSMKLNDSFDVLATPKSNYFYVGDIVDWFRLLDLRKIKSYEHPEAGITAIGYNE